MSFTGVPLCGNALVAGAFAYQRCNLQASGDERICALQKTGNHGTRRCSSKAFIRLTSTISSRSNGFVPNSANGRMIHKMARMIPNATMASHTNGAAVPKMSIDVLPSNETLDYGDRGWFRMGGPAWDRTRDQTIMSRLL